MSLPDGRLPVVLSSHEAELVAADAAALLRHAEQGASVPSIASAVLRTRRIRRHRAVIRAADPDELMAGLRAVAAGDEHPLVTTSSVGTPHRTAFVFPGHGNQRPGMGADAYRRIPVYRAEADRCAQAFVAAGAPSPLDYLIAADATDAQWSRVHTQAAQFTHCVALAAVWHACGVRPDIVIGHSLGEVSAACSTGLMALDDAVGVIVARAAVLDSLPGRYAVAALAVDAATAAGLAAETPGWLEVSVVNSPSSTAVAGTEDSVTDLVRELERRGVFARRIAMNFPAHTSVLDPLHDDFLRRLPDGSFQASPVEFVSAARGTVVDHDTDFRAYWYENLRNTVRFDKAVATAATLGARTFVEVSAHPALLWPLSETLEREGADEPVVIASSRRDEPVSDRLAAAITTAAVNDPGFRWADLVPAVDGPPPRGFPNAPMRAEHLWLAGRAGAVRTRPEPTAAIRTAHETWLARTASAPAAARAVAITAAPGADETVVRLLRDAVSDHASARLASVAEADVVAVVAPADATSGASGAVEQLAALVDVGLPRPLAAGVPGTQWLITASGEHAHPDDPPTSPMQSALAAMHRSVGFEHPDTAFAHLDLPRWDIDVETARRAVDTLLGTAAEVAIRDGIRFERVISFAPTLPKPLPRSAFHDVVITGGSGVIGRALAAHCAERGATRIVLLARRPQSPGPAPEGVELVTVACDITDPAAVAAAAAAHAAGDATLLIHAAGAAVIAPSEQLTAADVRATCDAKVAGLSNVLASWPMAADCRIVACSSASATWGGLGHAAYAAANRLLDSGVEQLRAQGWDAVSVRSGLWSGAGVLDDAATESVTRSGLLPMPSSEAAAGLLADHRTDALLFASDEARLRIFFEHNGIDSELTDLATDAEAADDRSHGSAQDVVRIALASVLDLDEPALDLGSALIDIGVDSLLALDLRKHLLRATGQSVSLARLLGGISGLQLADALTEGGHRG